MSVEIVTFGCRLNAFESEVIARAGRERRADRHHRHQQLRGDQRSRGAGAAVDPPAEARAALGRGSSSPAAPRRRKPAMFADMAEVDRVLGNDDKMRGEAWRAARVALDGAASFGFDSQRKDRGHRHHGGQGDGAASARRIPEGPAARLRAGAERLRPSLHLLHHSLWPRQFALGADGRGGRTGAHAGRARPCRDRADRRRPHQLRRRSAGRAEARATDEDRSCGMCRN